MLKRLVSGRGRRLHRLQWCHLLLSPKMMLERIEEEREVQMAMVTDDACWETS